MRKRWMGAHPVKREELAASWVVVMVAVGVAQLIVTVSPVGNTRMTVWSLGLIFVLAIFFPLAFYANTELGVGGLLLVFMLANNLRMDIASATGFPFLPELIAVVILFLVHLAKGVQGHVAVLRREIILVPVALFGASLFLSSLLSGEPESVRLSIEALLGILAFWVIASEVRTPGQIRNLSLIVVLLVVLAGIFSSYRIAREVPLSVLRDPSALYSTSLIYSRSLFAGPMEFGNALVTILPLAAMSADIQTGWRRRTALASILMFIVLIILSFQRGTWLVAGILFVLWTLLKARRSPRWLFVLLLLIPVIMNAQGIFQVRVDPLTAILHERGVVGRLQGWQAGWEMMRDYPLFGVGLGQYRFHFLQYRPTGGLYDYFWHAHNILLNLGAEAGVLTLALFLVILGFFFKYAFSCLVSGSAEIRTISTGLILAMLGYLAQGSTSAINFVDFQHYSLVNTMVFWVLVAMAMALRRQVNEQDVQAVDDAG